MYIILYITIFLANSGIAIDPLEDKMAKMEEMMSELSMKVEALTKMVEEINNRFPTGIDGSIKDNAEIIASEKAIPLNDTNLEERVAVLEFQMENVQDDLIFVTSDVSNLGTELTDLEEDIESQITIIQADQTVQDQRLLDVEDEVELVGRGVVTLEETVNEVTVSNTQLNASVTELDSRVTTLESQNGTNDNITDELNELNQRVDALDDDITDVENIVSNLDEVVTGLEETTEELNVAVNDLDSRVSDLEASAGNGTSEPPIAFSAHDVITPTVEDSIVVFLELDVNLGNGYNNETGEFTVPPGGAGVYFLFFYTLIGLGELAQFIVARNGDDLCRAYGDHDTVGNDYPAASCGTVAMLDEGEHFI